MNKNTHILQADAEKYFDKEWLKDSLMEMKNLGYSKNDKQTLN